MSLGFFGVATAIQATTLTPQQLSEVWRESFPLANVEMAPSTFSAAKTAPWAGVQMRSDRPHPAVARIVVPEQGAISYGSGTLIDVRDDFGLVITNWHVVRDATGAIEVRFPDGFTSKARALKVDADWDLAALVVWRPSIEPVSIAAHAPQPGDRLTICGYGQGDYRRAVGRCTQYYAPRLDFPRHMVELDVEARQGDSGGPIFNEQGELAGVLFGAGQGTTLGSFGGRVGAFLATLAPDIGRAAESLAASQTRCPPRREDGRCDDVASADRGLQRRATLRPHQEDQRPRTLALADAATEEDEGWPIESSAGSDRTANPGSQAVQTASEWPTAKQHGNLFEQAKSILAVIGLLAIVVQLLRVAR